MAPGIYNNKFQIIQKAKDSTIRICQNGLTHTKGTKTLQKRCYSYKVICGNAYSGRSDRKTTRLRLTRMTDPS